MEHLASLRGAFLAYLGELTRFSRWGALFPGWKLLTILHAMNSRADGGNEGGNAAKEGISAFWSKAKGRFIPLLTCLLNPILNTRVCTDCVHCGKFYSEREGLKILFLIEKRWIYEKGDWEEKGEATLLVQCARLASEKSVYFKCSIFPKFIQNSSPG